MPAEWNALQQITSFRSLCAQIETKFKWAPIQVLWIFTAHDRPRMCGSHITGRWIPRSTVAEILNHGGDGG
jgi:hypothetical protein